VLPAPSPYLSTKQVIKGIRHKAASPQHTDSSIVFARWHQCARAARLVRTSNRHPHCTAAAPCGVAHSISTAGHVRACPWPTISHLKIAPSCVGIWTPSIVHISTGPPESTSETASRSVQLFLHRRLQRVLILYNRPPPQKLPFGMENLDPI